MTENARRNIFYTHILLPDSFLFFIFLFIFYSGTVAALQVLTRAQSHVAVDADILSSAKRWLQLRQRPDGGFSPTPEDDVVGSGADDVSLGSDVEVTSETLAALLAVGMETEVIKKFYRTSVMSKHLVSKQ